MRSCVLGILVLAACSKPNEYVAPPPPKVTVATPEKRDVTDYVDFTGVTAPHVRVEIRARVQGFLGEILYKPGTVVEAGTDLFKIDPSEYLADVESAQADVDRAKADKAAATAQIKIAEANLALAETAVKKLERAYELRAVSEIQVLETKRKRDVASAELAQAKAQLKVAEAAVTVAKSTLARAQLKLGYATIKAPITGRVAKSNVEVGDLVGAGEPTLLTTIVNLEKIHCNFDVAERWALEMGKANRAKRGGQEQVTRGGFVVHLGLVTDEGFPHKGVVDYIDPTINADTGTIRIRAIFDNAAETIPGGAFVRVRLPIAKRQGALLVSERALGNDQSGTFVLVVNAKGVVERRTIELGAKHGDMVVVLKGLRENDRVIVGGQQRARPGTPVTAETASGS